MGVARFRPLEDLLDLPRRSPLSPMLEGALAAASGLHGLRSDLDLVPVRLTATTSESGAYRYRKADPIDLRVSRLGDRLAIGFLHELGHLVDHQLHDPRHGRAWASTDHPAFAGWRAEAARLGRRPFPGGRGRRRYFQSVREVWARAYAQTVLLGSHDARLQAQLEELQRADDPHVWPAEEFTPVARAVELVFERLGLTQLELPIRAA